MSPDYDYPLVMKVFKPERTKRIRREILILKNLKGGPNIIPLIDVIKDKEVNIYIYICNMFVYIKRAK